MKPPVLNPLSASLWIALATLLGAATAYAQTPAVSKGGTTTQDITAAEVAAPAAVDVSTDLSSVGPALNLTIGKSTLLRMPSDVTRISMGNPIVADVTLISPTELYLLGKTYGSTNLIVWRKGVGPTAIDVNVNTDYARMEAKIRELLPEEKGIKVRPAADSVILTGVVSSAVKAKAAEDIANAFVRDINKSLVIPAGVGDAPASSGTKVNISSSEGGAATEKANIAGAKVVNRLRIAEAQQVMLEVKIAEVSKTLLDKFGLDFSRMVTSADGLTSRFLSGIIGGGGGVLGQFSPRPGATVGGGVNIGLGRTGVEQITPGTGASLLNLDLTKKDGIVKILAEPNIIAISGQEASFLAGGKIFIPVADGKGGTTLEEREFGVGLKFTPTVLEGGRIHLKVAPEVSELSQLGAAFTTVGGGNVHFAELHHPARANVGAVDGRAKPGHCWPDQEQRYHSGEEGARPGRHSDPGRTVSQQ